SRRTDSARPRSDTARRQHPRCAPRRARRSSPAARLTTLDKRNSPPAKPRARDLGRVPPRRGTGMGPEAQYGGYGPGIGAGAGIDESLLTVNVSQVPPKLLMPLPFASPAPLSPP